jgi:hypothetical protein
MVQTLKPVQQRWYLFNDGKIMTGCLAACIATLLGEPLDQVPCITRDGCPDGRWITWLKDRGYHLEPSDNLGYNLCYTLYEMEYPSIKTQGAHMTITYNGKTIYDPDWRFSKIKLFPVNRKCDWSFYMNIKGQTIYEGESCMGSRHLNTIFYKIEKI